jgi:transposase
VVFVVWTRLADHQWEAIRKQLPPPPPRPKGGRPLVGSRKCLEGILWILWTGAQWAALPERYGARSTVHDRLTLWVETGVFLQLWRAFLRQLDGRHRLMWQEGIVDGCFVMAKKGGPLVGPTKRGKGSKLMVLVDGCGTPLGVLVERASPAEVKLLEPTLAQSYRGRRRLRRLIADRAYDSNPARQLLVRRKIEPIIPARCNNRRATHQDGRKLRRFRHRWIVERTNAWLQWFRRILVRHEYRADLFLGLVHFACALVTLRKVSG